MQTAPSLASPWAEVVGAISQVIDLEATARASGALVRRREIRSAAQLPRLALAYGPGGLSLRAAATWAGLTEGASLSDTAVMKRLGHAAAWLGEIAGALVGGAGRGRCPAGGCASSTAASSPGRAAAARIGGCTRSTSRGLGVSPGWR